MTACVRWIARLVPAGGCDAGFVAQQGLGVSQELTQEFALPCLIRHADDLRGNLFKSGDPALEQMTQIAKRIEGKVGVKLFGHTLDGFDRGSDLVRKRLQLLVNQLLLVGLLGGVHPRIDSQRHAGESHKSRTCGTTCSSYCLQEI